MVLLPPPPHKKIFHQYIVHELLLTILHKKTAHWSRAVSLFSGAGSLRLRVTLFQLQFGVLQQIDIRHNTAQIQFEFLSDVIVTSRSFFREAWEDFSSWFSCMYVE